MSLKVARHHELYDLCIEKTMGQVKHKHCTFDPLLLGVDLMVDLLNFRRT